MRPIPKRLLPFSCEVRVPKDGGLMGGEYEEPVTLAHVAVEPVDRVRPTAYQLQDATNAVMYVDAVNTEGAFHVPSGSLVTLEGETSPSSVSSCHEFAPYGRVHHWELELK